MFKTGNPVVGDDFIDRKKHLPLFKTYIEQSQHIMIKAPRRFGKTSLVKHLLENKQEYSFIYIDIKRVSKLKNLADNIIDKAYALSKIDNFLEKSKTSLLALLKSLQKIKIDSIGEVTINFQEDKNLDEIEYFLHSLDVLNSIAVKLDINVKFAMDEFQDILKIANKDILDKTRSVIQHHTNITYIFLGSIESMMTQIFESKSSPFFHFAKIIKLPPLDINELYSYSYEKFKEKNIVCDDLKYIINFLGGHPDYSMQVLQKLYFVALAYEKEILTSKDVYDTLVDTIWDNKAYIDELISKSKQKKHHLEVLVSIANTVKIDLDSKSLYNVHISLENMGLIRNIGQGKYEIVDLFLQIILEQKEENIIMINGYKKIGNLQ